MDPVRPEVVKLPVSVGVTLLEGIVGAHTQIEGNNVGLNVRKMIEHIWHVGRLSVHGKGVAGNVVAASHGFKEGSVRRSDRAELRMAIVAWGCDIDYIKVMDHPAFVPAALIVDNEQSGNIGEDVDKRSRVSGIGRKTGLGLQYDTNGADGGQAAIGASDRQLCGVIDTRDDGREDVGFKTGCIEQVVLEQLASAIGFSINL